MIAASAFTGRLRRRNRARSAVADHRTLPGGNPLYISRLTAALADAEHAKGEPLTRSERRRLERDLRAGIDPDWSRVPAAQVEAQRSASGPQPALRGFPGGALPAEDVPQSWPRGDNPYRQGPQPSFTPHAEQPPGDDDRTMLRRLESGLRGLDWAALDEARQQGMTYAQAHAARGGTPLGDKAERNSRAEVRPVRRHGEAALRRVGELKYPKPDVTVPVSVTAAAYDAVMRHADAITGTRGIGPGTAPLPAITAGSAG